ncbi:MAG: hypothetical protein RBT62_11615 [Spirochaetia bacterium]|jgi:hypothetical protein|nr:hypothetical protein [Spirochaetia bacterium]
MNDKELQRLSNDIEDLKRAIKHNDPLLREMVAPPGWFAIALLTALTVSIFALASHVLVARYGSFGAIPPFARILLFVILGMLLVIGAVMKTLILTRRATKLQGKAGISTFLGNFYGGDSIHQTIPLLLGLIAATAYAVYVGHPWMTLPISAFLFGLLCNSLATRSRVRSYYIVGYWGIFMGLGSLPFVELVPFLCLFVIYGGMMFAFAVAQAGDTHLFTRLSTKNDQATSKPSDGKQTDDGPAALP